jgi:hypothetical protein
MATTLTVKAAGPSRVQLRYNSSDGAIVYLKKSGATGDDKDLSALVAGPLKACLTRSTSWIGLSDRIIVRMTIEGPFNATAGQEPRYQASGTFSQPSTKGISALFAGDYIGFTSPAGAAIASFELQYIPSNQR